jgi:hypothetical protein
VGDNSIFQKKVLKIISLQWMLIAQLNLGLPFLFNPQKFECQGEGCEESQFC